MEKFLWEMEVKRKLQLHVFHNKKFPMKNSTLSDHEKIQETPVLGKYNLEKPFILIKEVLHIFLHYLHSLPVSHYLEGFINVYTLEELEQKLFWNVHKSTGSEHEDCYWTFKILLRNFEYCKCNNFKKHLVFVQSLSFLGNKYLY